MQSQNLHSLVEKYYTRGNLGRYVAEMHLQCLELAGRNLSSFRMNEQNKDAVIKRYDQDIYDCTLKMLERDEYTRKRAMQINEERTRWGRNLWKKEWRKLRLF